MAVSTQQINRLKEAYADKIALITDTFENLKASLALEVWEKAEIQYQGIMEAEALSYSTTGRSVSKRDIQTATNARNQARAELEGILGTGDGGVTFADFGGYL
jgi:hypothetical protein